MAKKSVLLDGRGGRAPYSHNMVFLHEARLVASEEAEHREHEGHNGTSQWKESC
jgi:hypothetical protein